MIRMSQDVTGRPRRANDAEPPAPDRDEMKQEEPRTRHAAEMENIINLTERHLPEGTPR